MCEAVGLTREKLGPSYSALMLLTLFRRHSQGGCGELYGSSGAAEVEGEMLAISLSF